MIGIDRAYLNLGGCDSKLIYVWLDTICDYVCLYLNLFVIVKGVYKWDIKMFFNLFYHSSEFSSPSSAFLY